MIIKIPFKTPTVNHLYGRNGNRSFLKAEAKRLREEIKEIVHNSYPNLGMKEFADEPLKVTTYIYEDWYTKKGTVKRVDIANREKFLIDSVFDALGIDDKFIFEHKMIKKDWDNSNEHTIIEITPL